MPVGQAQEKPEGRGKQRWEQPPFLEPHLLKPGKRRASSVHTQPGRQELSHPAWEASRLSLKDLFGGSIIDLWCQPYLEGQKTYPGSGAQEVSLIVSNPVPWLYSAVVIASEIQGP